MKKMSKSDCKNEIFCKKWHIHLYMSFFFCNFAPKFVVRICTYMHTNKEMSREE